MEKDFTGSFFNYLSEGCRLCYKGAKMVLFVTGTCQKNCFYCPVSNERRGNDVVFANERIVRKDDDIIEEAISMDALGTGITGGEPLLRLDRVIHYIKFLKNRFGKLHHIHLYTAFSPNKGILESLKKAGLDEIRFHPPPEMWKSINRSYYRDAIVNSSQLGLDIGFEIPCITSDIKGILSLLEEVDGFLNLNELEFSETNMEGLKKQGYEILDDESSAVRGSMEIGEKVEGKKVHFCSSRFKDAVQLRERFKRIAKHNARYFDEVTDDGTLVYGSIDGNNLSKFLLQEAGVDVDMFSVLDSSIETAWWIAEDLALELKKMGCTVSVIERHPMKNGLVVEKTPL
jgi:pyruvate formate-lyase activating enzyme-like uncharacterized protein